MGTRFTVKVVAPPSSTEPQALQEEIHEELAKVNALMSTYQPDSEVSRFNRFDRIEWFPASPDSVAVIEEALNVGRLTGGAFDITVAPLVDLWNFGPDRQAADRVPSAGEIDRVKVKIGFTRVEVRRSPPAVRKQREDLSVDLSGVAKGYAVDKIAELLEGRGIGNYMVDVGGEVKARGRNQQGKPWQIAVESPVAGERRIHKVICLDGLGLATSGDYRNYFEKDGVRYSHIIDPRTGRPITHRLASVSVLAQSCMRADAMATALMVLGPEAGYQLALQEELAALFIVKSDGGFTEKMTPEFEQALRQPEPVSH